MRWVLPLALTVGAVWSVDATLYRLRAEREDESARILAAARDLVVEGVGEARNTLDAAPIEPGVRSALAEQLAAIEDPFVIVPVAAGPSSGSFEQLLGDPRGVILMISIGAVGISFLLALPVSLLANNAQRRATATEFVRMTLGFFLGVLTTSVGIS